MKRFLFPLVILPIFFSACTRPGAGPLGWRGETMGTTYQVQIADEGLRAEKVDAMRMKVEEELKAVNAAMSTYMPDSEISRFNRSDAQEVFPVSNRFLEVLGAAFFLHADTGGVFEPTLGPLIDVWGFGVEGPREEAPSSADIDAARARVGMDHLSLEEGNLRKTAEGVELNLSAIAKGYAVDRVLALLRGEGYENVYVEIGGEVACRGVNARGIPWVLGIQAPTAGSDEAAFRRLSLENRALATSGDYRNFVKNEKGTRHHILDPRTGRPTSHSLASVSVMASDCMTADAVATALYVMGTSEGMLWLAERPQYQALFIDRTEEGFKLTSTSGFEQALFPDNDGS